MERIIKTKGLSAMKILLVAIDSKYIHTNLAVLSLRAYAGRYEDSIYIAQYTINHTKEEILRGIYLHKPDVAAFSCYIWNIEMVLKVAESLKKVLPQVKTWFGGPEVSYNADEYLKNYEELDGVVIGEGERTFYELAGYYLEEKTELDNICGIAFKDSARIGRQSLSGDTIIHTLPRRPIPLDEIPFAYRDADIDNNRIIYYESSRGCPYSCSYCLSSVQRGVRYRGMELVKSELKLFLDHKVPQVKFVDRTFNCNKERAIEIWKFIRDNDNGITNFHFEITADLLSKEELEVLKSLRPGLVQFEIGVQTTNPDTMKAVRRTVDFYKLAENVKEIRDVHNIHQHLDLIAGLPLEDYASFEKSFEDVYRLRPDQLQLGFLKVLKGSIIENECGDYGIVYNTDPPYEVLHTNHISYDEILELKGISRMVDVYYNSGQFTYSLEYLEHFFDTPMKLYAALYGYYCKNGLYELSHSRAGRYEILMDFFTDLIHGSGGNGESEKCGERLELFKEILLFDYCLREGAKNRPDYFGTPLPGNRIKQICGHYNITGSRLHIEKFNYNIVESAKRGTAVKDECIVVFDYDRRNPVTKSAAISIIRGEQEISI